MRLLLVWLLCVLSGFAEHGLLFWPDPTRCAAQAQAEREGR